ncbi:hypothetical protein SpCBS45565_g05237 [Spizellomyces sp. 'palustris']|nr:hypothetical protein SpCBS45565_g05237 [Spizellomyces sp. 'palustris']
MAMRMILVEASTRIEPDIFYYSLEGHNRLFRLPIRLNEDTFISATFILDTGASSGIYVNQPLDTLLATHGRIREDELGLRYTVIDRIERQVQVRIERMPENAQVNTIGLPLLLSVGLSIENGNFPRSAFDQEQHLHIRGSACSLA